MLKRCQILLADWQEEYIRDVAQRYDQSFSEVVRLFLSLGFMYTIPLLDPEYKVGITGKQIAQMIIEAGKPNTPIEDSHKYISKAYFEARKAVEYRLGKIKVQRKT